MAILFRSLPHEIHNEFSKDLMAPDERIHLNVLNPLGQGSSTSNESRKVARERFAASSDLEIQS